MNVNLIAIYTQLLSQFLSSPAAVFVIFGGMVLAVGALVVPSLRWVFVAGALWASTLPINAVGYHEGDIYVPLAFPLEQIRLYARPLTLAFMFLLLLPLTGSGRGWRRVILSGPLLTFFFFQASYATRLALTSSDSRGFLSLVSFCFLLLTFGLAVSLWLQSLSDVYKLLYAVCGAGGLVVGSTCYQLAVNRGPIIVGGRLSGLTGNPQFLAIILALTMPAACFLFLQGRRSLRPLMAVQIALSVIMLIWTGSRTGMIGMAVALLVLFHRRVGRLLVASVVVGVLVLLVLPLFEGSTGNLERFVSSENTRAGNWSYMLNQFLNNPWFGSSRGEFGVMESSYLAMLSLFGVTGCLPFFFAMVWMGYRVLRLQQARAWMGDQQQLVDLMTAFWASVAVMAMFEGFLMGVIVIAVLCVYLFADVTAYLQDHVDFLQAQPAEPDIAADPWQVAA